MDQIGSSSDEDDIYKNPVACLKAMKCRRLEEKEEIPLVLTETPVVVNAEEIVKVATNDEEEHSRVDNLEHDVEIVSFEESPSVVTESCENGVIALSDDEICKEDDNYEMNIKILWRSSRLDRLSMRRHDNFLKIFQHYAALEKVPVNEILIMKEDKMISDIDTPALLKLSVIDILDGGIVNPGMKTMVKDKDNENVCSVKVQMANKKQPIVILLKKNEQFKALFAKCAEQLGMEEDTLKFYFDGEQIDYSDTPESLDLEGEACIDLHISS